jgi:hypothetical protein
MIDLVERYKFKAMRTYRISEKEVHAQIDQLLADVERGAFLKVKEKLCQATNLYSRLPDKPFLIRRDSSDYAFGACLSQVDDSGKMKHVAFASVKLSEMQKRWPIMEKEDTQLFLR